ncbi:MAG: tyrosine-type recombinase/integrase [Candidatus Calescibacterium sp.]|nr:tyrosine-type recombinase/integrase [Candidatus Calescibacterium sp.]
MSQYILEFISFLESKNFSANTLRAYMKDLEEFSGFISKDLDKVDFKDIEKYIRYLSEEGKEDSTIERKLSSIKSFFRFLEERGYVKYNPAELVPFRKRKTRIPSYLDEDEALDLTDTDKERDRLAILILYGCGLRVSELENLKLENISGDFLKIYGKGGKWRSVPIPTYVREEIDFYIKNIRPKYLRDEDDGYLLLNKYGKKLSSRYIRKIVKRQGFLKTGKNVWPHLLRHSYATHLLKNQADIRVIQELLGHSSINTTQKYVHTNINEIVSIYKKVHPRESEE